MERFNIYYRRDGRWEGRISCGKNKDGKRKFKYFLSSSKEKVIDRMRTFMENKLSNIDCDKTVFSIYSEWINSIQFQIKESTIANYKTKAIKHIIPEIGSKTIRAINKDDIHALINKKLKEGLSNRYVGDIIITLKSIFKYAASCYNFFNPLIDVKLPKRMKSNVQLLDVNEEKKLREFTYQNRNESTLGVILAMTTGIRIGELCALKWSDINLKKQTLTISKTIQRIQTHDEIKKTKIIITEPKSETSKRIIPIPTCIIPLLKEYKTDNRVYLLSNTTKPIEPRTMQYRFKKILQSLALPSIHFHALRHMFASRCVKLGFDIKSLSEILGHSSVEITLNRYVHSSFEQKVDYMNRIDF